MIVYLHFVSMVQVNGIYITVHQLKFNIKHNV